MPAISPAPGRPLSPGRELLGRFCKNSAAAPPAKAPPNPAAAFPNAFEGLPLPRFPPPAPGNPRKFCKSLLEGRPPPGRLLATLPAPAPGRVATPGREPAPVPGREPTLAGRFATFPAPGRFPPLPPGRPGVGKLPMDGRLLAVRLPGLVLGRRAAVELEGRERDIDGVRDAVLRDAPPREPPPLLTRAPPPPRDPPPPRLPPPPPPRPPRAQMSPANHAHTTTLRIRIKNFFMETPWIQVGYW